MTPKTMTVAGVMSGTSADGVDVALVRVSPSASGVPKLKLLGHSEFPYPRKVRGADRIRIRGQARAGGDARADDLP